MKEMKMTDNYSKIYSNIKEMKMTDHYLIIFVPLLVFFFKEKDRTH